MDDARADNIAWARLTAAAAELLAMLEEIMAWYEGGTRAMHPSQVDRAYALIAKAKGTT